MQKKSKVIGFDLDDILLNFNDTLRAYYNTVYKTHFEREHMISFHLDKLWGLPMEETAERVLQFYNHESHLNALPVEGSMEGIEKLAKNHTLFLITAKPELLREKTEEWLTKYFPGMFAGVHFTNHFIGDTGKRKKSEVCLELGIEVFVEDALHNAQDVADAGIPVLLFDTPWNQAEVLPPITRVFSWPEIVEKLNA